MLCLDYSLFIVFGFFMIMIISYNAILWIY